MKPTQYDIPGPRDRAESERITHQPALRTPLGDSLFSGWFEKICVGSNGENHVLLHAAAVCCWLGRPPGGTRGCVIAHYRSSYRFRFRCRCRAPPALLSRSSIDPEASAVGSRSPASSTDSTDSTSSAGSASSSTSAQPSESERLAQKGSALPEAGTPRFLPLPLPTTPGYGGDSDSSGKRVVPRPVRWFIPSPRPKIASCFRLSPAFSGRGQTAWS